MGHFSPNTTYLITSLLTWNRPSSSISIYFHKHNMPKLYNKQFNNLREPAKQILFHDLFKFLAITWDVLMQGIYTLHELVGAPTNVKDTAIIKLASNEKQKSKSAYKHTVSFTGQTSPAPFVTPPGGTK